MGADMGDKNFIERGDALADAVRFPDFVQRRAQRDRALMDHCDVISDLLHFLQPVRRKEHRATFIGDGAKDGAENVAANDGIEAGRRFIQHQ